MKTALYAVALAGAALLHLSAQAQQNMQPSPGGQIASDQPGQPAPGQNNKPFEGVPPSRKVYVLQGNEELVVNSLLPDDNSCGALVERLKKDNFQVQGINFGQPTKQDIKSKADVVFVKEAGPEKRKQVPADAWAVVVLGPSKKIPQDTLNALDDYMKKDGRMLVTLGFDIGKDDKKFVRTGIEEFLQKFGVGCDMNKPDERYVIKSEWGQSLAYSVIASPPEKTTNDVAKRFFGRGFEFLPCRAVRVGDTGRFKGDVILQADPDMSDDGIPYLVDNILNPFFASTRKKYFDRANSPQREARVQAEIPVAVAVSQMGSNPGDKARPRLVVFGNTSFVSNYSLLLNENSGYALFVGALDWMDKRPVRGFGPKVLHASRFELLEIGGVQKDIKATPEQAKEIVDTKNMILKLIAEKLGLPVDDLQVQSKAMEILRNLSFTESSFTERLTDAQTKRLSQLELQAMSSVSFLRALANNFKVEGKKENKNIVNKEQNDAIVKIYLEFVRRRDEIYNETLKNGKPDVQKLRKKLAELERTATADMVKILTAEQRARWQEIIGEPFVGDLPRKLDVDFLKKASAPTP